MALVPSLPGPRAKAWDLSKVIQSTEVSFAPSSVWTAGFCKHAAFGTADVFIHLLEAEGLGEMNGSRRSLSALPLPVGSCLSVL